jgi:hypothetical protein
MRAEFLDKGIGWLLWFAGVASESADESANILKVD